MVSEMVFECPICKQPLRRMYDNPNIFECPPHKVDIPELNTRQEIQHVQIVAVENKIANMFINTGLYSFDVFYQPMKIKRRCTGSPAKIIVNEAPLTIIRKLEIVKKPNWDRSTNKQFIYKELLRVNAIVDLFWSNKAQLADRVKLYLLFS